MASPEKQTSSIRRNKTAKAGKKRKTENRNKGTTKSKAELFGDDQ